MPINLKELALLVEELENENARPVQRIVTSLPQEGKSFYSGFTAGAVFTGLVFVAGAAAIIACAIAGQSPLETEF